jgi:hypothetical protein
MSFFTVRVPPLVEANFTPESDKLRKNFKS